MPLRAMLGMMGSLPAVFFSTFVLTVCLFRFYDQYVAEKRINSKALTVLFAFVDSIYATIMMSLYDSGVPVLYLLLFVNIFHTLEHAYMGKDAPGVYLFLGSGSLQNYLMGYIILFSIYRIMPVDIFDVNGKVYQQAMFATVNVLMALLLLVLMSPLFPTKELRGAIHTTENRLMNIMLPISNIVMFLFGVIILPVVHTRFTDRVLEVGFYSAMLCWAASNLMTWWVVTMYQAYRIRVRNSMQVKLGQEREMQIKLKEQADRQPLTGLYNRRAWEREVRSALAAGKKGYLIMLDLDHFKEINDNLGHPEGDRILKETADMLRQTFRKMDLIGHIGGDEFCVFLVGELDKKTVNQRLDYLMELRRKEFRTKSGGTFCVSFSMGYAAVADLEGTEDKFAALVSAADAALYWQKEHGRNGYTAWSEDIMHDDFPGKADCKQRA